MEWYRYNLGAKVVYEDATWALLNVGGGKIALTLPRQHPGHIAFDVGAAPTVEFLKTARKHRDGSLSKYGVDPDGNAIEWIYYPEQVTGEKKL